MSEQIKSHVTNGVRSRLHPSIARQDKTVVISEVVRLVFDHHGELGIAIVPPADNAHVHYERKLFITKLLHETYSRYASESALASDIITDLLAIMQENHLAVVMIKTV